MKLVDLEARLGRRFARVTTNAVVSRPRLWRGFRWLMRAQFQRLAPVWDSMRRAEAFAALERALDALPAAPKRVLDLGTGTGLAAFVAARRFPKAEVVGVDLAPAMVEQARQLTPPELLDRVRFEQADAAKLQFEDGAFDLVQLANMIPFFDELARVTAPGGHVVFSFSAGRETPIWVSSDRLRSELSTQGFAEFADFEAEGATALLARKGDHL
jgi:ubiquinone/menaquinone biosynthesis C-methylase UbiE